MTFSYIPIGLGWMEMHLKIGLTKLKYNASHLGDAPWDLLRVAGNLNNTDFLTHQESNDNNILFFDDEHRRLALCIKLLVSDNLDYKPILEKNISIKLFGEREQFDEICEWEFLDEEIICSRKFSKIILDSTDLVIARYGIMGLNATWAGSDFPFVNWLSLKFYAKDVDLFCSYRPDDDQPYSNLKDEIKILQEISDEYERFSF